MTESMIAKRYLSGEKLGTGGMGTVYRGQDTRTGETVAIKQLKPDIATDDILERFKREGEALRELNHPNIVKMLDAVEDDGKHYLIMEYVSGGDLSDLLKQGQLPVEQILKLSIDLADALTRAHKLNIIHRDLKPGNVLIAEDGTLKLSDFGVAHLGSKERVTDTDAVVGTIDYLPPEAFGGESFDERGDIWAFGVILFEMLTGERPFKGETILRLIQSIATESVPDLEHLRPDLPPALIDLVYRMLEKNPQSRLNSVRHAGAALEDILYDRHPSQVIEAQRFDTPASIPLSKRIPDNLPAQSSPFVGREPELNELARLLQENDTRLITIVAPGGTGKTRLAIETASVSKQHYADGVFFVELAPLSDSSKIHSAIAEAVNYQFQPDARSPQEQLVDFFRDKQILLILDNFEHLIDSAVIVTDFLQNAARMDVIATSRERLSLSSEHVFALAGMDVSDWQTLDDALEYSAVQLFVQSAKRVHPGYELTEDELPAIARICYLVEGSPLGIVLAAAWQEMLDSAEIVKEMESSIDFLETTMRDLPERQRSMRAIFDYSWNLLTEDEQATFMKTGIFKGGFTREAVQQITGASLRTLMSLLHKSLISRDSESGRYHVHELTRQYAEAKLRESDDYTTVADAHSIYYLDMLPGFQDDLLNKNQVRTQKIVEKEFDNILLALDRALEDHQDERIITILQPLTLYYFSSSAFAAGVETLQHIETTVYDKSRPRQSLAYWKTRVLRISMQQFISHPSEVEAQALELIPHLEEYEAYADLAHNGITLARTAMLLGDLDKAADYARQSAELAEQSNAVWTVANSKPNIAYIEYLRGNIEEAIRLQEEIIADAIQKGASPFRLGMASLNMGEFYHAAGDGEKAAFYFQQSYENAKITNNIRTMAHALTNLGNLSHTLAHYDDALDYNNRSLELFHEIGDRHGMADAKLRLADALRYLDRYDEAGTQLQEALLLYDAIGDMRGAGNVCVLLANLVTRQGNMDAAGDYMNRSLEIRRIINNPVDIVDSLSGLGMHHTLMGNYALAEQYLDEADAIIQQENPGQWVRNRARGFRIMLHLAQQKYQLIYDSLISINAAFADKETSRWGRIQVYSVAGTACVGLGKYDEAIVYYTRATHIAAEIGAFGSNVISIAGFSILLSRIRHEHQRALSYLTYILREWQEPQILIVTAPLLKMDEMKAQLTPEQLKQAEADSHALDLETISRTLLKEFGEAES